MLVLLSNEHFFFVLVAFAASKGATKLTPMLKEMQFALKCVITCYQRDSMPSRTDFYVQTDYPSDPEGLEAVKAYRQALRDISEQSGFPRNVQWPEMPAVLSAKKSKLGLAKVGI